VQGQIKNGTEMKGRANVRRKRSGSERVNESRFLEIGRKPEIKRTGDFELPGKEKRGGTKKRDAKAGEKKKGQTGLT